MVTTSRSARYTSVALDSFFAHTRLATGDRFFLIDNDGDFSPSTAYPRVELLRNASPASFATNVNQVIHRAAAAGADVLFMNNDVVFTPDWVDPLLDDPENIVLPVCNQHFAYRVNDFSLAYAMDLADYAGHESDLRAIVQGRRSQPEAQQAHHFLRVSFFCFRLPRAVHRRIGLFDETFGTGGGEDTDYQVRALLAGLEVRSMGASYVLHFLGKSTFRSGETPLDVEQNHARFASRFREKWGQDMADVFLFGPSGQHVIDRLDLGKALARGDYGAVARACRGEGTPGTS